MNDKKTEVVLILDKSGSMAGKENDTIGGYNSFIENQKEEEGECFISTYLFSNKSKAISLHQRICDVDKMNDKIYSVGGCTALLDAIGEAICDMDFYLKDKENRNVIFVIITDGEENSSKEFNYSKILKMIKSHKESNWKFIFLGANIDIDETAKNLGINEEEICSYSYTNKGVRNNFKAVNCAVSCLRTTGNVDDSWKNKVEK